LEVGSADRQFVFQTLDWKRFYPKVPIIGKTNPISSKVWKDFLQGLEKISPRG